MILNISLEKGYSILDLDVNAQNKIKKISYLIN